MKWHCFLDDHRVPQEVKWVALPDVQWRIVRNYREFIEAIERLGIPETIAYDHDLGPRAIAETHLKKFQSFDYAVMGNEKTGKDCAEWVIEHCRKLDKRHPEFYVHSQSPAGAENIRRLIVEYQGECGEKAERGELKVEIGRGDGEIEASRAAVGVMDVAAPGTGALRDASSGGEAVA